MTELLDCAVSDRPLIDVARRRALEHPERLAFRFLADGEAEEASLTYAELDRRARALGAYLQEAGLAGERALLLYPPGLEFVTAFLGCLYGGVVAVPAYPPRANRADPRLLAIVEDARPRLALTTPAIAGRAVASARVPGLSEVRWVATEEIEPALAERWRPWEAPLEAPAFLQYTSGSTSTPKGVVVRHGNLAHNERLIQLAFRMSEASVAVGWLPLYHDMGLIGQVLQPLYSGGTCTLMSPVAFLQRPLRWLEAISRYRATSSGGPNFAYELCVRKIAPEERATLDLSSWELAFSGAEPVRADTLERFAEAFAPCGFRYEAFYPCYGLAEATLFVSGAAAGSAPAVREVDAAALERHRAEEARPGAPSRRLVGCGVSWLDQRVEVVAPETARPCAEGEVGEVWVAGPSVAGGYWNRPEETARTFAARLATEPEAGPFLRTGDLGFVAGGELYISGRIKDLIIVRGRNLYPQDVELTVERSHPALRPGCGAAFAVEVDGEERLVLVQEVERDAERRLAKEPGALEAVADAVRRAVAEEHEVAVHAVALLRAGSVPKTSSGKIRRQSCKADFLAGRLEAVGEWRRDAEQAAGTAPRTPTEERLERIWAEVLELGRVSVEDDLFALGVDSLRATQLVARVNDSFGGALSLETLFAAPTIAVLAALLDGTEASATPAMGAPPILPAPRDGDLPLSFAQRRLWFLHQLDPENPVHNIAAAVRIEGALDAPALARALSEIVRRHEALRAAFAVSGDEPVQVIRPAEPLALPCEDLSALPAAAREVAARDAARGVARLPFDLERGPFLRAALVRLGAREHDLVLALHHIAADGGSLAVLVRELGALYTAFVQGRPSPLPEPPVQYADFARWQREWLTEEALAPGIAFWRERLGGERPALELPADRPRPAVSSFRGAHVERLVPAPLVSRLEELARGAGATLFMTLLAGFEALLHRVTGAEDLVVGSPIAGRTRVELEGLIGVFINNLVLRTSAAGEPTFRELLARVRETALAAYAHQEVPFERLVDELQPERDLSRSPLFQVMFVGQNAPLGRLELPGLTLAPREVDLGIARFDLSLSMGEADGGWLGTWKLNTDLFDPATMHRLARHLEALLQAAAAEPDRPISRLPLLDQAERHQVVTGWNDTRVERREGTTLHELIAAQIAQAPNAIAVEDSQERITYAELGARAHHLAVRLRALGVGTGSLVGIAAERSVGMVAGLVGILEAGGAYVPLDPSYPADRLAYMLGDSGVQVLLTQSHVAPDLPSLPSHVLLLDDPTLWTPQATDGPTVAGPGEDGAQLSEAEGRVREHRPEPAPPPATSPAYAIYTSGSTGRPKGAAVPHQGIVNRLLWMQEAYNLTVADTVLQKTPYSFDVSVWELFWPLVTGARLVMAPPGAHQDAARLAALIRDHGVTTLHFVPSMLQVFLEQEGLAVSCATVRQVFASGEALPFELKERFLDRLPGVELHNLYGPTEASVDVTYHACTPGGRRRTVPIGRPIANTSIVLLDRHLEPVPVGIPGELHIGGVGLAIGYLRRPELTAGRFVPDPTSQVPGARLYKTGDLARFRPDGEIEFLGRLDHQVKIRGVRIELGEIEAALGRHPSVRETVVLARRDGGADARLVAYLVPAAGAEAASAAELRGWLRERLPDTMVPSAFVTLPAFPLTPSGKVDRKVLPAPEPERPAEGAGYVAPRTPLEARLAAIWSELLKVERIGVHDDFFELGGDSIQGAMLVNRLQKELGQIVYVMALFDAPTIAELADYLTGSYPEAAARLGGGAAAGKGSVARSRRTAAETEAALAELAAAVARRLGREAGAAPAAADPELRLPPAVFLLSPFRSGSTLLRVMLAGHSRLFAPPELELLAFRTMGERARVYSGRNRFAVEGLLRAVMELEGCDAERARRIVGEAEAADEPVERFFARLQGWVGDRLLVDKTPSYALDVPTLRRAELLFDGARYVHLVRHPRATIDSYLEAKMDRVYDFPFPPEEQAELVWLLGHRNVLSFLSAVPAERQHRLHFEDLVKAPREAMEALCAFLGLELEEAMLAPYEGRRMTDGLHAGTRMMGDPKFHQHQGIDAAVADRWREGGGELGEAARDLEAVLGYEAPAVSAAPPADAANAEAALELRPAPRDGELPLSFAQERLWFLSQLDPDNPAYNMPAAVHLAGRLDVAALAASFAEVRRRHEVLRTVFPPVRGLPAQRVLALDAAGSLPLIDLSDLPAAVRVAEQRRLALAEGRRPFDLARGPMLRTTVLRLGASEHVLLVTMHHIASDGWTIGILIRELEALYTAFSQGRSSPLRELPLQYADYAAWQRRWLDGPAMERHLAYWRRRLAGRLPVLELPTDRPRPALLTARGARLSRTVPRRKLEEVRAWSQRQGATLFLTLLAGFDALLHRWTGQDDLLLGIPIANRNRVEVEGLIGFFLNMVVERADASADPAFRELLARVREGFLGSTPHQEVPFEKLVEDLQPERDLSRTPIFQVQFSLQNTPGQALELPGLTLTLLENHNRTTKFDMTVFLFDEPEGLRTTLEYNADLFDEPTIGRLLAHWETLLTGAVAGPERRLSELPMLTEVEHRQLFAEWNTAEASFAAAPALHRLFERQAALRPDDVAVVYEVEELTYRRLNERANRLARRLRALGVGPEVPVGLCVERSVDLIVGLLGILKAGGAYVPLDPAYPPERLAYILDDALAGSTAPVLVTQDRLVSRFRPEGEGAAPHYRPGYRIVRLDADRASLAQESAENLPEEIADLDGDHLAYVIYTSGSTGRPKGVPVPHANVVRLFGATRQWFDFGPDDVWTMFHSSAFDFSVWEIWGALLHGGRLVVVPREAALSPALFHELLVTEKVTVLDQTPSAFRQLIRADEEEDGRGKLALRWVIFGGEALDLAALAPWVERHGDERPALINMYGITETTVHVTWRRIVEADLERPGVSPVGVPIPDLQVHLLGRSLEPLPVGVPGEIHVGGAGLARGYLNRPELSAERFIPDPFSAGPGARLYRSGDLARRRPDGEIEYLGRIDGQVKIRGFRIELGEIEAALNGHPQVRESVVMARPDATGGRRLVAWVVPRGAAQPSVSELREHLGTTLPEYMVPAAFVILDRLPLTGNGKVDRRALPEPGDHRPDLGAAAVAPRTPTEERLAAVWREVLRLPEVGAHDDFFELGGHSLLVAQLASRVLARFGVELPLRAVFEAPTLAAMAARLEALLPEGKAVPAAVLDIPRADRGGDLPLSFAQERLWFLDQLEPGSPLYNVPVPLRLSGRLSVPAFEGAFREIVRRHEALRTSFRAVDGTPVQVVEPDGAFEVPLTDLSMLPEGERDVALVRLAEAEARTPFDLGRAPLVRARLVRLAETEHAALVTLHHIVSDGWSMGVLVREVAALYETLVEGTAPALPELPVQYADYAVWQRRRLAGEALEAELAHWRSELAGSSLVLDLPTDRPRPPVQGFRGRHLPVAIPARLVERVKAIGLADGATLFMTLLAAFETLLHRYTGQEDFLVGSPVANRTRREVEDLIGFFVNTLALRARLDEAPTFRDLVGRVKERTLAAQAHQDLPFERLVEALEPERDLSRAPLFQVLFVLQNAPLGPLELPGLTVAPLPVESGTAKFDLTLSLMETADGLGGFLEYATDLFEEETARRLLTHFQNLLESAVAEPERRVADVALLSAAERRQLLVEWNQTRAEHPRGTLVHELVAAQAALSPERPAVSFGGATLTYRELDERANRLANHLRSLGAGPERLVGLCVERSAAMVVSLLGILKAGAAYVPLDPGHPAERLALVLEDARPAVLVTEERLLPGLAAQGTRVVCLDRDATTIAAASDAPSPRATSDEGLAYVIYTSGSTGRPKGVQLPHRAVVNFLRAMAARPGLGADDVVPALTTLAFDIAGLEIWLPLMVGARVEVVTREEAADGRRLAERIAAAGVTVMQATPATWRLLVESGREGGPGLKALCGGEALPRELADELLARGLELWNVYGPTETAIWSAAGEVRPGSGPVRLGRAIDNTRFYVVDRRFEPVPAGVPGELWIAGDGLARGYLGRPELTAEKFVPDPWSDEPGARLYRTGDLVRWRDGGDLEFLGRIDHQVKVRGYRIELGEIEAALCRHPAVAQAVVVTRGEGAGTRLVAYLVAREGSAAPATAELRTHLSAILPEYMLPAVFMTLATLPLNPSGKVDRKALPEPERAPAGEGYVTPRDPRDQIAELVAGIWSELLGVERVGAEDDFFELGGHSLLATQLASRLRGAFGVELPVRRLFEARTVATLAEAVRTARRGDALPPIRPVPREGDLPLSFAQERLWFVDQLQPGDALYNLPAAVRLTGRLDAAALVASLDELVRRHEALRTTFRARGGRPVQVVHPPAPMALERIDLSAAGSAAEAEARRLATAEAVRPFGLAAGPLVRAALLRLAADDHVLLLTMHHIVSDGWSMGVLLGEVAALYAAFVQGRPSPLPELPIQYPDFAVWQRGWLQGEALADQLGYWTRRLAGSSPLHLPVDRQATSEEEFRAADLPFRVPAGLTEGLKALGRRRGTSLFMTLLAAFQALLARHTGQGDVAVGSPVAGRNRAEIEPLIGLFINTLVLRTDAGGEPTFGELLERVREATLGAYDHQDLPFARLVEALRPERHLGSYPLVQVLFALQNQPIPAVELPELAMRPMPRGEVEDVRTSFALALRLWEDGGGLAGGFGYNSALFDGATLERWRDHLLSLLAAAVEDPQRRLSELLPLPEAERRQVLAPVAAAKPAPAEAVAGSVERQRADLASRRQGLSDAKRELLARRLRGMAAPGTAAAGGSPPAARPAAPSVLVKLQAGSAVRRPFFCVHAIGGTVFSYGELARFLGPERPFWGVQAAGLENGGEPERDVVAMASRYVAAVQAVDPEGPYLLGGWSFGGVVAFEMARQLRERGFAVGLLALFDSWAPIRMDFAIDRDELDLLRGFLRDQAGMLGHDAAWIAEPPPPALPASEQATWLLGRAREAGLLQSEVKPERVKRLLAVYRANLEAYAGYRPQSWEAAVTLYRPEVTLPQPTPRPVNGWEELTSGPIEVHTIPGDHYTMLTAPGVRPLAELLSRHLERAADEAPAEAGGRSA